MQLGKSPEWGSFQFGEKGSYHSLIARHCGFASYRWCNLGRLLGRSVLPQSLTAAGQVHAELNRAATLLAAPSL